MCGRFSRFTGEDAIINRFNIDQSRATPLHSYNIAPSQRVSVIYRENPLILEDMRWGYIPFWAKSPRETPTPINARDDSLGKKMYSRSLEYQRCIIPANGFYEWKLMGSRKQPFYIKKAEEDLMGFGGIYSYWRDDSGNGIYSFAIITTSPNELMSELHDRMPLILNQADEAKWLDDETPMNVVRSLIKSYNGELESYPVSTYVNSPTNDDESCIHPIDEKNIGRGPDQHSLEDFF